MTIVMMIMMIVLCGRGGDDVGDGGVCGIGCSTIVVGARLLLSPCLIVHDALCLSRKRKQTAQTEKLK